jgi:dTDP-4-amino-4,6-dideoxygalactose transaminase
MTPHETPLRFAAPCLGEPELARVRQSLAGQANGDLRFGTAVESRLERLLGCRRVLLTTSCTHALELAFLALPLGPGREVICPSFTFVSTANAILRAGGRPVFADIEPRSLGLDPDDVRRRISPRTAAILPVHYAGIAPDMDPLLQIARERGLAVVEDAAHALGATYRGRPLGTLGDAGCFSFHESKNLTCGEGGALALNDPQMAQRAEIVREKGTNRAAFLRGEIDRYTWVAEGSSYVLSDILAAVLDAQLDRLADIQRRRAQVCSRYRDALRPWAEAHGVRLFEELPERSSAQHIFFLLLPDEPTRDHALGYLRDAGVPASFHYVPLHSSPFGQTLAGGPVESLPITERIARTILRLPLHPGLTDADIERVVSAVRRSLG